MKITQVRGNNRQQRGSSHIARVRDVRRTKNRASRSMNQEDRRAAAAARRKELMMMKKQKKTRSSSKPGRGSSSTAARLQGRSVYANAIRSGIGRSSISSSKKNGGIVGVRGVRRRRNRFR